MKEEILKNITAKREFSQLPKKDLEMTFSHFENRQVSDEEKVRLTRELLHKVFGAFSSRKLMGAKQKDADWVLKKHMSTRERFPYYGEIYKRIFSGIGKKASVIDFGAGVNGFSYDFFKKVGKDIDYTGIEAVGQLVESTNNYFKKENIKGRAICLSLFEKEKIKKILLESKKPRIIFLFKVIDSLEMLQNDYSKKFLLEIGPLSERIIVSFATRSMIKRKEFHAKRNWIINFISDNFKVIDDFNFGGERYFVFKR